jgi:hypothetical protein
LARAICRTRRSTSGTPSSERHTPLSSNEEGQASKASWVDWDLRDGDDSLPELEDQSSYQFDAESVARIVAADVGCRGTR